MNSKETTIYENLVDLIKEAESTGNYKEANELRTKAYEFFGFEMDTDTIEFENSGATPNLER